MTRVIGDVDIDVIDREEVLKYLPHIPASRKVYDKNQIIKHNNGVYITDIPYDPITGLASIDFKKAEELGYYKLDFLNKPFYKLLDDEVHLDRLLTREPKWEYLRSELFVKNLEQISNYWKLINQMRPNNIHKLAMFLAIIRPGKVFLKRKRWDIIETNVWTKPDSGYYFKKSHAYAYARLIMIQMNYWEDKINEERNSKNNKR